MTTLDELAALARGLHDNDRISADIKDVRARLVRVFADGPPRSSVGPGRAVGSHRPTGLEPR